jgi:transposase InsO family protein
MRRRGNCYDNAVMESFFATATSEEGERFESYEHAKEALFDYIEVVLQPATPALHAGPNQPGGVRATNRSRGINKLSTKSVKPTGILRTCPARSTL